ncbi:MAG: sensor domain-containing diguanylate cyclase [Terriglobales bacterium]
MKEFHSRVRELAVLQEATDMVLSSKDADTVLHHTLLVARNYFGVSACAVMLVDTEKNELYIHTHNGFEDREVLARRYRIGRDGVSGHVAADKAPIYVPDVAKDSRYVSGRADIRCELALPLLVRDEVLGVLTLSSNQADYFTDEMIGLLALFAGQAAVALDNTRLYSTERRRMRQIEFVNLIARSATTAHDLEQLLTTLAELITDTFEGSQVSILLRDASGGLSLRAHAGGEAPPTERFQASLRHGTIADALDARMNVAINHCTQKQADSPSWSRCLPGSESEMGVPLLGLGESLGVIVISHAKANAFSSEERSIAQAAADVGATAIRNVQLSAELLRLANTDGLTGVFNQRYFHVAVGQEITRAKRFGKPFSILMFDLKHFKDVNRQVGFDAGDEVLRGVAQLLRSSSRAIDTVCRYRADCFAIVLPETSAEQLQRLQAKVVEGLATVPFDRTGSREKLEAVFASVQHPQNGATESELVRQLLQRMEQSKTNARGAAGA